MTQEQSGSDASANNDSAPSLDPKTLLQDHGDALYRFAWRALGDPTSAEDVVQMTLVSALKGADTYDGRAAIRTWLISILRRKIVDHLRKMARDEAVKSMSPDDLVEMGESVVEASTGRSSLSREEELVRFRARLNGCLELLPPNLRHAFVLRDLERMEVPDVCDILGISTTNLSTQLYRARTRLRSCLESDDQESDERE
ncbi:MAG: RNA polymerase sigma factor [Phycisphaerae bacterium]